VTAVLIFTHYNTRVSPGLSDTSLRTVGRAAAGARSGSDGEVRAVVRLYLGDVLVRTHPRGEHGTYVKGTSPRPDIVARVQAIADRNIARFGLLEQAAEPTGVG
jgi:hypothetical protein